MRSTTDATPLGDLQRAFSQSLLTADDPQLLELVKGNSDADKTELLNIYRNNVFYSLTNALADLHPVIKRLVGEQFFNALAGEYIRQRPPRSAAMVNFGADFAEFIAVFEHTAKLPYLTDVARLELAWHRAYHADDVVPLTAEAFSALPPERLGRAGLLLHPSVCLLDSAYPVLQIWDANRDGPAVEEFIDLDSGGVTLCVTRPQIEVVVFEITGARYRFLCALQNNENLETALQVAQDFDSTVDVASLFATCIQDGLFMSISGELVS